MYIGAESENIVINEDITGLCSKVVKGVKIPFLNKGENVKLISNRDNDVLIVEKQDGKRYPVRIEKTSLWQKEKEQQTTSEQPLKVQPKEEILTQDLQPKNTTSVLVSTSEQTQVLQYSTLNKKNLPKLKQQHSQKQQTLF